VAAAECDVPGAGDNMTSPVDGVTVVVVTAVVEAEVEAWKEGVPVTSA